jgi:outer membrane protein assembly factor BamB
VRPSQLLLAILAVSSAAIAACGSSAPAYSTSPSAASIASAAPSAAGAQAPTPLQDWPLFGLTPQRYSSTSAATGITAANVGRLHRLRVSLPGTVDSSAVYLHQATVAGGTHDVAFVTTTYGRTLAVDANSGSILWSFTPPGYSSWAGSAQVTTATPAIDPDDQFVYATASNGKVYKLSVSNGRVAPGWPVSVTYDPGHEKLASPLNIDGPYLVVTTGGYYGDIPPYVGHVALIDRASGQLVSVWNSLCANRRGILHASTCNASDSAIFGRAGAVVEPNGNLLVATGNAPYNGTTNFGDSVIELTVPALTIRQVYTPTDQAKLNVTDTDLGSTSPALLGDGYVMQGGKDGILRLLRLDALDGRPPGAGRHLGGEVQELSTPGGNELFSAPAVVQSGTRSTVFVADASGTSAFVLSGGRLHPAWSNTLPGTSAVVAGGLLYVYDLNDGGVNVYRPSSPRPITTLASGPGHWNSPIVVDGHVIEPEGNYMDHSQHGTLDIWTAG